MHFIWFWIILHNAMRIILHSFDSIFRAYAGHYCAPTSRYASATGLANEQGHWQDNGPSSLPSCRQLNPAPGETSSLTVGILIILLLEVHRITVNYSDLNIAAATHALPFVRHSWTEDWHWQKMTRDWQIISSVAVILYSLAMTLARNGSKHSSSRCWVWRWAAVKTR